MSADNISEVIGLFKSYSVYAKQFFAETYAKEFFDPYETFQGLPDKCRERMNYIQGLISGLAPSDFATLLNLHYINNLSMEKCAECMAISKRSAYRLLNRAHIAASNRHQRMKGGGEE
jgi:hypothetical protein